MDVASPTATELKKSAAHLIDDFLRQTKEEREMLNLEETLGVTDLMRIFRLSRNGIYLRLRRARAGLGGLPLPIASGEKQRLRWSANSVRLFLESTSDTTHTSPTLKIETTKTRDKRHAEAMKKLASFGIVPKKEQK